LTDTVTVLATGVGVVVVVVVLLLLPQPGINARPTRTPTLASHNQDAAPRVLRGGKRSNPEAMV
jgi:hypothetical protein